MARQVTYPWQIPDKRAFNGKTFTREDADHGAGAKQQMQDKGEWMKQFGKARHYRVVKYDDVLTRIRRGEGRKRRTWYVLFAR